MYVLIVALIKVKVPFFIYTSESLFTFKRKITFHLNNSMFIQQHCKIVIKTLQLKKNLRHA